MPSCTDGDLARVVDLGGALPDRILLAEIARDQCLALGASRSSVLQMVAMMGLKLVGIGGAIEFLASFAATRVLAAQLTNLSRLDPVTLVGVVVLMAIVGLAACCFPARRAMRLDPMVALREG